MKSIFKFVTNFFSNSSTGYIGLSSFKPKKVEIRKEDVSKNQATTLTGILKRVN